MAAATGCREGGIVRVDDQRAPFNRWTITTMDDEAVSNAIVAQHTLYPYHFVNNSAELNALGERDVKILAQHLARTPGEINVRRAGTSSELYEARMQSVTRMLVKYEVPQASIKIADKLPGGEGVDSERAVLILRRSYEQTQLSTDGGSSSSGGGSSSQQTGASMPGGQGGAH
jgi:hypothetical protein